MRNDDSHTLERYLSFCIGVCSFYFIPRSHANRYPLIMASPAKVERQNHVMRPCNRALSLILTQGERLQLTPHPLSHQSALLVL